MACQCVFDAATACRATSEIIAALTFAKKLAAMKFAATATLVSQHWEELNF